MTQAKHTQGSWIIGDMVSRDIGNGEKELVYEIATHSTSICDVYLEGSLIDYPQLEEGMANARLIAAAPELLEMLEDCLETMRSVAVGIESQNMLRARQLLGKVNQCFYLVSKAKGES